MQIESLFKEKSFELRDGVYYFTDVPQDYTPPKVDDPLDVSKWSEWRKRNFTFFKENIAKFPSNSYLIDLGAGPQYFLDILRRFKTIGVDFYPYRGVRVVCNLNKALPFKDGSFDIVFMSNVLEHIAEPTILLSECYRILKKDGMLIGTVPFLMSSHQRPYDFYRYTDIGLIHLLVKIGFKSPSAIPLSPPFLTASTAVHRLFITLFNTRFSDNFFIHKIYLKLSILAFHSQKLFFRVFKFLYKKAGLTPLFTEGYGFIGYKLS